MICLPCEILDIEYKRKALEFNIGCFVDEKDYSEKNFRSYE